MALGGPAAGSCLPPAPVADNAARAVAVVYGTVTDANGGAVTLRVKSVLKGQVGGTVRAFVGPGRGGVGGPVVATSIDYGAAVGTEHVLYLVRAGDGQLETNACIGSHPGAPDATEIAYFGAGASPAPGDADDPGAPSPFGAVAAIATVLLAAVFGAAVISWRRRRTA